MQQVVRNVLRGGGGRGVRHVLILFMLGGGRGSQACFPYCSLRRLVMGDGASGQAENMGDGTASHAENRRDETASTKVGRCNRCSGVIGGEREMPLCGEERN